MNKGRELFIVKQNLTKIQGSVKKSLKTNTYETKLPPQHDWADKFLVLFPGPSFITMVNHTTSFSYLVGRSNKENVIL